MVEYISKCGTDGYSASTDVFLDHHLVVVLNRDYRSKDLQSDSGDTWTKSNDYDLPAMFLQGIGDINFIVLSAMCGGMIA